MASYTQRLADFDPNNVPADMSFAEVLAFNMLRMVTLSSQLGTPFKECQTREAHYYVIVTNIQKAFLKEGVTHKQLASLFELSVRYLVPGVDDAWLAMTKSDRDIFQQFWKVLSKLAVKKKSLIGIRI